MAKYLIIGGDFPVVFPSMLSHADMAARLVGESTISAGSIKVHEVNGEFEDSCMFRIEHGSQSLRITRDVDREAIDLDLIKTWILR